MHRSGSLATNLFRDKKCPACSGTSALKFGDITTPMVERGGW